MKLKIECEIEIDEDVWYSPNNKEEQEWFKLLLNDKENIMLILWSNDIGDEIGQTSEFKWEIIKSKDDFAIRFLEWIDKLKSSEIDTIDYDLYLRYNTKELLEIYKKEKGL